jgi:hypothetical protein
VKQFKYVGPYEEVEVPALGAVVAQGETVQVETDLVDGFEGQEVWEHVPDPERSKAAKKAAAARADDDTDSQEG